MPSPHRSPSATAGTDCIHDRFAAQAAATPERIALIRGAERVSYAALNARANRIAHRLRALGAGPETIVGVHLPRAPELVASLLGILKSGAAYLPLDPAYPPARTSQTLKDARPPFVLAHPSTPPPAHAGRTLFLDELVTEAEDDPPPLASARSLAYVIYTSGSTGRPKGVMIEHRQTVAFLHWLRTAITDEDRALTWGTGSICFDMSVVEIFGTLCWGGTLVLADDAFGVVQEPVRLASLVPSVAAELLRRGTFPPTVRTLALGGEAVPRALADRLFAETRIERLLNPYGPTEDTTYSSAQWVPRDPGADVTIGAPLHGGVFRVMENGAALPDGATGELHLSGPGLSRGYLHRPALTAARFLPDPLATEPGARLYRTGDRVRRRPDGEYDWLGRVDRQVKIRGVRVEPDEVEAVLATHPDVRECAVLARTDAEGAMRLVAWTAPEESAASDLRAWLAARLPPAMVPERFGALAALPHTPNSKVDRAALGDPAPAPLAETNDLPRTPAEQILCGIWAEVLGRERVGPADDFFALGGHSLRAAQIVARIQDALGVRLSMGTLFHAPTVRALAAEVERARGLPSAPEPRIGRADRAAPLPLSPAQEAVWFFERLSPGMRSYQFQAALHLRGALNVDALRRALSEIVRRHEIFRTTFVDGPGAPVQVIHPAWQVSLPAIDATADGELQRRIEAESGASFDPGALPLVRWTLLRTADDEHVLLCVEHHLVHDGWSFGVFLRELTALYAAFAADGPSPLPEPEVQFADVAAWQREWLRGGEVRAGTEFWRSHLAGAPPGLDLPADFPRPPRMSFRGESIHVTLPAHLARAADTFSRAHGVTLYMTLLAAFQALMARYTGAEDFVLGGGSAGRRLRASEGVIGMLVNVIPLRADLSGDPGLLTLVDRVRREALAAYPHADVPFAAIVDAIGPERTLDRLPLFQHAFNIHHAPYPELRLPGLEVEVREGLGNRTAKFDLQVIVIPRAQQHAAGADDVTLIWEFSTDLFRAETVRRMTEHYHALLAAALADPRLPLSAAPLVDADEQRRWMEDVNRTATEYPRDATLAGLVAEQAARAPNAVAVDWSGRQLTYRELDALSGGVAARLRALRLPPESRVGIALPRSPEMVAALLGAAKAGCAYVPLDPEYPAERLRWMLDDAHAAALVFDGDLPPTLAGFAGPVIRIGATAPGGGMGEAASFAAAESLACVLYTSGSTGRPKGVAITHRGITRLVRGADFLALGPGDRVAQTAAAAFDAFLLEVWGALLNGACLVGVDRADLLSPPALAARLRDGGVTTMFLTTALFNQLGREAPETFAGLRTLLFGGDVADPGAVRRIAAAHPGLRLVNGYGPTENTTFSTWHAVEELSEAATAVPIGRPLAQSRAYLLDAALRPVPTGLTGELYVAGDGLARGYLDRPALTAAAFLPDPFGAPGARMYRTGDRARWTAEGVLEFRGRADQQVKLRGFRVEPGEVEALLRTHPDVADAACIVRADAGGERVLVAYAAVRGVAEIDGDALRGWLAERLPSHMVPATVVPLAALPLTPSGKVDRAALPVPVIHPTTETDVAPLTEMERVLAPLWAEVLGIAHVRAGDGFFALGGHSLRVLRLLRRVEEETGVRLSVAQMFENPTLREMARRVEEARDAELLRRLAWLESMTEDEAAALLSDPPSSHTMSSG